MYFLAGIMPPKGPGQDLNAGLELVHVAQPLGLELRKVRKASSYVKASVSMWSKDR